MPLDKTWWQRALAAIFPPPAPPEPPQSPTRGIAPPPPPPPASEAPAASTGRKVIGGVVVTAAVAGAIAIIAPEIKRDEGLRLTTYNDIVNVPTACWGHTGRGVERGRTYSMAECEAFFEDDIIRHTLPVLRCVPGLDAPGRENQLAASISLAFNIGTAGFCRSTVARRFNAGNWRGGCDAFLMWNRAGGKEVRGLTLRRQRERALCLRGL